VGPLDVSDELRESVLGFSKRYGRHVMIVARSLAKMISRGLNRGAETSDASVDPLMIGPKAAVQGAVGGEAHP
jgi:hypothetical protein